MFMFITLKNHYFLTHFKSNNDNDVENIIVKTVAKCSLNVGNVLCEWMSQTNKMEIHLLSLVIWLTDNSSQLIVYVSQQTLSVHLVCNF